MRINAKQLMINYVHFVANRDIQLRPKIILSMLHIVITESQSLEINIKGQITNVLPLVKARAKRSWLCDTLCKIDDPFLINRYEKFLQAMNTCTFKKIPQLLQKIHKCTRKQNSNTKLGHTHACYIDTTLCKAMSLSIQLLYPHFPKVRHIKRLIYQMTSFYQKMLNLEKALISADLETLNDIITVGKNTGKNKYVQTSADLYYFE